MASTEPQASKPYRICPEIVEAKDTPCRVLGPTAVIVNRMEVPNTDTKIIKIIKDLEEKIKTLEEENTNLKSSNKPKVDVEKPTVTRGIRG